MGIDNGMRNDSTEYGTHEDAGRPVERLVNCLQRQITDFGRMNRANRIYFGITLKRQADELQLGTAQLSGYEVGREPTPESVRAAVFEYWAVYFKSTPTGAGPKMPLCS